MFNGFFGWLRGQVKQAVLGGVSDAITELDNQTGEDEGDAVPTLQARLKALPAPPTTEDAPLAKTRKTK